MAELRRVADVKSIPSGSAAIFDVGAKQIAVFNVGGGFYAIDNICPHRGGPVGEGSLHGTTVSCPWHGAQFEVTNGQVVGPPATADITSYATKVEEDGVWVEIP
jgi:nitrite reductase (NADH) small subunit/3-phenylpropionate/trans-cinnamate dioxygenase ferredoxin subunit